MRVRPIVKISDDQKLSDYLLDNIGKTNNRGKASARSLYAFYHVASQLGLRAGDILAIKKESVIFNSDGTVSIKPIVEQKTGKQQLYLRVHDEAVNAINMLFKHYPDSEYVFVSSKKATKPIDRNGLCSRLKIAAKAIGIEDNIGTHSMRKTMAFTSWAMGMDDGRIQSVLNHKDIATTSIYSGSDGYIADAMRMNMAVRRRGSLISVDPRELARRDMMA